MKHNTLFRESLRLLHKFHLNFGLRAFVHAGKQLGAEDMLQQLLLCLFTYSLSCLRSNHGPHRKERLLMTFAGFLNHTWGRIAIDSLLKTENSLSNFLESHIKQIIEV